MWWLASVCCLFVCTAAGNASSESTPRPPDAVIRHKFAVVLNFPKTGEFAAIYDTVEQLINSFKFDLDEFPQMELVPQIISLNTSDDESTEINRLKITREVVCKELLDGSVASILVQHSSFTKGSIRAAYSVAAYALGFYRVPTIGVMIQDAEFSRKNLYPTFLRTSPPFSNEAIVVLKLLHKLKYRQVVVITVIGDVNGQEFTTVFEDNRISHDVHVQKYMELHINESLPALLTSEFEDVTSNTIVLCTKKTNAEEIFEAAAQWTGAGKMWIINQAASQAANLPQGVLSVKLKQTTLSALKDALLVIKNGVKTLGQFNGSVLPPQQCSDTSVSNEWTNNVGYSFYRNLIQSTDTPSIKFNSKGDRIQAAYEVLNRQDERQIVVGYFTELNGLILQEKDILWPGRLRTKPLEITLPKHLRAVTVADPPFVYTVVVDDPRKCATFKTILLEDVHVVGPWYPCPMHHVDRTINHCCAGYAIDLLSNLSLTEANMTIDTGFTFDIHLNSSYGSVSLGEEGYTLNGLVGELDADSADLAIGALTINPEREHYIDFSEPWLYHGIRIIEKWQPRDSPMQSFLQPLKPSLWYCLFVAVIVVGSIIFVLDWKSPFDRFYNIGNHELASNDPFWENVQDDRVTFAEAMWFVWGVLLNSGVAEKTPRSFSSRVLGIVWCGFCMIMVASYTANLAAFLVLDQPEKSLSGINDPRLRNPSTNFSYATVLDTNTYQFFKRHVELSTMYRKMEGHNVKTAKDGIDQLMKGTLGAFIWDSTRLDFEAAKNCELRTRGSLFGRSAYGIGLQKHSPWTQHITNAILRLAESGMMERLNNKWIESGGKKQCVYEVHKAPARLGLINMKDIFILVSVAIVVGAVFSVVEVTIGRRKERQLKTFQLARRYAALWLKKARSRKLSASQLLSPPARKFSEIAVRGFENYSMRSPRLHRHSNDAKSRSNSSRPGPAKFVPDLNFNRLPVKVYCSRCRHAIETVPRPVVGPFVYLSVGFLIVTLMWPCAPLPCFLTMFADFNHECPVCGHIVGKFRRGGKPKFYV